MHGFVVSRETGAMSRPHAYCLTTLIVLLTRGGLRHLGSADTVEAAADSCVDILSATFEDGLSDFNQSVDDSANWLYKQAYSLETTLSCDRTTLKLSGHLLFLNEHAVDAGKYADLLSPEISLPANRICQLQFYINMFGSSVGNLSVLPFWNNTSHRNVWSKRGQQTHISEWKRQEVDLSLAIPVSTFRLLFRAIGGTNSTIWHLDGDIAIDDITITCCRGCPSTSNTVANFDTGMDGYTQSQQDDFDWTRNSGSTLSDFTGPQGDHTHTAWTCNGKKKPNVGLGYYMYIEVTPTQRGHVATMLSPTYSSTANGTCFVSFWYNMYVKDSQLDVGTTLSSSLWCRNSVQTTSLTWLRGEFWFFTETIQAFKLNVSGTAGISNAGDIAIDDISIVCCQTGTDIQFPLSTFECFNGEIFHTSGTPRWKMVKGKDHTTSKGTGHYVNIRKGALSQSQSILGRTYTAQFRGNYNCSVTTWAQSNVTGRDLLVVYVNSTFLSEGNLALTAANTWQSWTFRFSIDLSLSTTFLLEFATENYSHPISLSVDDISVECTALSRNTVTSSTTSQQPGTRVLTSILTSAPLTTSTAAPVTTVSTAPVTYAATTLVATATTTPATSSTAAPVTTATTTSVTIATTTSVTTATTAPVTIATITPAMTAPTTPVTTAITTSVTTETTTPVTNATTTPVTNATTTPVSNATTTPVTNATNTPVTTETTTPVTDATTPVTTATTTPVTNATTTPVTNATTTPITNATTTPVTNATTTPVTNVTNTPVTTATTSPVTNATTTPATNATTTPVTDITAASVTNATTTPETNAPVTGPMTSKLTNVPITSHQRTAQMVTSKAQQSTPTSQWLQTMSSLTTNSPLPTIEDIGKQTLTTSRATSPTQSMTSSSAATASATTIIINQQSRDKGGSGTGIAVGAAVGGVIVISLLIGVACYRRKAHTGSSKGRSFGKVTSQTALTSYMAADVTRNHNYYEDTAENGLQLKIFKQSPVTSETKHQTASGTVGYVNSKAAKSDGYTTAHAPSKQKFSQDLTAGEVRSFDGYAHLSHVSPPAKAQVTDQYSSLDHSRRQHPPAQGQANEYSSLDHHGRQFQPKSSSQSEGHYNHTSHVNDIQESAGARSSGHFVPEQQYSQLHSTKDTRYERLNASSQQAKSDGVVMAHTGDNTSQNAYAVLNTAAAQPRGHRIGIAKRPARARPKTGNTTQK